MSAAPMKLDLPLGCIMHFSSSCLTGDQTLICNSINDLSSVGFKFTHGSFYINEIDIKHIIFFEELEYEGRALSIAKRTVYNTSNMIGYFSVVKAKSVMIVSRT